MISVFQAKTWVTSNAAKTVVFQGQTFIRSEALPTVTTSKTQTGKTSIYRIKDRSIVGTSKITASTSRTQLGTSKITASTSRTQLGTSKITAKTSQANTGVSNISEPELDLNLGLRAYWNFNEDGNIYNDNTLNGHDFQLAYGYATHDIGKVREALLFNGDDAISLIPGNTQPISNYKQSWTITTWIRPNYDFISGGQTIMGNNVDMSASTNVGNTIFKLNTQVQSGIGIEFYIETETEGQTGSGSAAITEYFTGNDEDNWTFIAFGYDAVSNSIFFKANDQETKTLYLGATVTPFSAGGEPTIFHIGGYGMPSSGAYRGAVDSTGVWARKLHDVEIVGIYNFGEGREYPFPINKSIIGKSRIAIQTDQYIDGVASIENFASYPIEGVGRITHTTEQDISGLSRVVKQFDYSLAGLSRVTSSTAQPWLGRARINNTVIAELLGKASLTQLSSQSITGRMRIAAATSKAIPGKSKLVYRHDKNLTGKSKLRIAGRRIILIN